VIAALLGARALLKASPGPLLVVAAVAGLLGVGGGWWAGAKLAGVRVAQSEAALAASREALAEYRRDVATAAADAAHRAREAEREAYEARIKERDAVVLAINEGFKQLNGQERITRDVLKRELAAPEWACLRDPLPAAVVERLLQQANTP